MRGRGHRRNNAVRRIILDHQPLVACPRPRLEVLKSGGRIGGIMDLHDLVRDAPETRLFPLAAGKVLGMRMHDGPEGIDDLRFRGPGRCGPDGLCGLCCSKSILDPVEYAGP